MQDIDKTFYDLGNVYVFFIGSICIHGKELFRQFTFHQKYRGKSHFQADVRDIWTVDSGTIRWDFFACLKLVGKVLHGNSYLWSMMEKSSVSRMQRLCILRFCVVSWKCDSEPNTKHRSGTTVGLVQRFTTKQNCGRNWRRTDGIRVEYFPRIHYIAARPRSTTVHEQNGRTEQFQGRIIFMSMFNDIIWWSKDSQTECIAFSIVVSFFPEGFPAGRWSFFGFGSETKRYIPPIMKDLEENGTKSLNWWWSSSEKADTQFSEPRVHCLEERYSCADADAIETVFRTLIHFC